MRVARSVQEQNKGMERIDDLQFQNLKIIQDTDLPCFTQDSIQLLDFLRLRPQDRVIDLGCGTGVLSILGHGMYHASFTGLDCQEALVDLAIRSAKMNGQQIDFRCMDVSDAPKILGVGRFTAAVSNPPYYLDEGGGVDPARDRARHGTVDELDAFCKTAFQLLNNKGKFFLCYPAEGLSVILSTLSNNRLEPKRIQFVKTKAGEVPYLVLIEAMKLGKSGLIIAPCKTV